MAIVDRIGGDAWDKPTTTLLWAPTLRDEVSTTTGDPTSRPPPTDSSISTHQWRSKGTSSSAATSTASSSMDLDVEQVRLLRYDGEFRSPHRLQKRCPRVSARIKKRLKHVFFGALFVSLSAALIAELPIKAALTIVSSWIDIHPAWGALLLPLMFCIAIPLAIPATMLEILGGSVFGLAQGVILNAVGKTCGSLVAFLLGKRLGKERLGSYLQSKFPLFTALTSVVEGPNWKPLLLIQLSSIPPVVKCYGLSITDLRIGKFGITSFIGGFPSALMWAYIGFQTKDLVSSSGALAADGDNTATASTGATRWIMLSVGLVCTVLAMGFLFVYTRRELNAQLQHVTMKENHKADSDADDDTESETALLTADDDCEVVVTQVAMGDSQQQVAKRTSIV